MNTFGVFFVFEPGILRPWILFWVFKSVQATPFYRVGCGRLLTMHLDWTLHLIARGSRRPGVIASLSR